MRERGAAGLAVLAVLLGGCKLTGTTGDKGRATFQFVDCDLLDCHLDRNAVAAGGARTQVRVSFSASDPWSRAESSDERIVRFTKNGERVDLESGEAGTAKLRIFNSHDTEIDRIDVQVEDPAGLVFEPAWSGSGPLLIAGVERGFEVTPVRADGDPLIGVGAVHYAVAGSLSLLDASPGAGRVKFFTASEGPGQIDVTTTGVSMSLPVQVLAPTQVSKLKLARGSYARRFDGSYDVVVELVAETAQGEAVFGASCAWSTTGPVIRITPGIPTQIGEGAAQTRDEFKLSATGSTTATCTIGDTSASLTL